MLIKNKKILSVFNCFWKVFCFCKMSKISKTIQPCSGGLVAGTSSYMPPVVSLLSRFSRLTGGSKSQSWKRLRKFFKNFGFLDFLRLCLATCSWVEASVVSLLRSFRGSLRDFLASGTSSRKKYLDKFFKFFCHKVFVDLV